MKTQMRFQKIFMIVSLIIAALCVVFALIFCSGTIYNVSSLYDTVEKIEKSVTFRPDRNSPEVTYIALGAKNLFDATQNVSDVLLVLGIIMVLCVVLNYIAATNKRRNYYITNYVAIGIVTAFELALAIVIIVLVSNSQAVLGKCDFEQMKVVYERLNNGAELATDQNWVFGVGYALAAILIVDAIGFVLNLVWKIKLMQGEKALLNGGLVKEVA